MKKVYYVLMSAAALMSSSAMDAQQLPNADFENDWSNTMPWVGGGTSKETGMSPESWTISHVPGAYVFGIWLGSTETGSKAEGNGVGTAAKVMNSPNSMVSSQVVPGYITLGTTWSTANTSGQESDGGTWGGIQFTYRPDAIQLMYKRTHSTSMPDETATVVVYSWKGKFVQSTVPVSISSSPNKVDMENRERNILGMTTAKGGDVTEKGELVSKLIYSIKGNAEEWTKLEQPISYVSDATPEMFNVIIAANDYFNDDRTNIGSLNTLTVDDVKLVYYSRLASLSVNGAALDGFASDTYEYNVDAAMPASADAFTYELVGEGKSAKVEVTLDAATATATVKVTGVDADTDGETSHTYTIKYTSAGGGEQPTEKAEVYYGSLLLDLDKAFGTADGEAEQTLEGQKLYLTPQSNGKLTLELRNLVLDGMELGDIRVEDVTATTDGEGNKSYTGAVEKLSLMGGVITAGAKVTGNETPEGKLKLSIDVTWNSPSDIYVEFNGTKQGTSAIELPVIDNSNAPVEFYTISGVRVNGENLPAGIYVRRQGTDVKKVFVK